MNTQVVAPGSVADIVAGLSPAVSTVRVVYPDLHGIQRGKDIPVAELVRFSESGLGFCQAVMGTDLRHTPVVGGERGYPDMVARPDLSTLVELPWELGVSRWCDARVTFTVDVTDGGSGRRLHERRFGRHRAMVSEALVQRRTRFKSRCARRNQAARGPTSVWI